MNEFTALRREVYDANMSIPRNDLAVLTWGNVSVVDRERGVFAIKPSGVSYERLRPEDIVVVDMDCTVIDGTLRPSSDTKTHAVLYRTFEDVGAIVHTHATYCVAWAQALRPIPIFGTTHADHTTVDIPCTPPMSAERINGDYETETGMQIVDYFREHALDAAEVEMVLVGCHGPFTWGASVQKAVANAIALEEIARMATLTLQIDPEAKQLPRVLRNKHYERKHGGNAYYGQPE